MRAPLAVVATVLVLASVTELGAQPLGVYRWQLYPYCNIISVAVTQNGGVYRLEGTDDQCGAATAAAVTGAAFLNPDGRIGFGLAVVASPGGAPVHVDAKISLSTLSGNWSDSAGRVGAFVFTPGAGSGGQPRPIGGGIGAAAVDATQVQLRVASCGAGSAVRTVNQDGTVVCELAVSFAGTGSATTVARSDHNHGGVQFRAEGEDPQIVAHDTLTTVVQMDLVRYNDGGGGYANGIYTIPVTGTYLVTAGVTWNIGFAANTVFMHINRNSLRLAKDSGTAMANTFSHQASAAARFAAGDTVRVQVYQTSGSNQLLAGGISQSHFSVTLIR